MEPIKFDGMTAIAAEHQDEYRNLPIYRDDKYVVSCWRMNWRERLKVLFTGIVWLRLLHSRDQLITPTRLETDRPFDEPTNRG